MTAPDWQRLGVAAVVACELCFAAPLAAVFDGIGVLGSLGVVFAVVEQVSIALAVIVIIGGHPDRCRCSPGAAGPCR